MPDDLWELANTVYTGTPKASALIQQALREFCANHADSADIDAAAERYKKRLLGRLHEED